MRSHKFLIALVVTFGFFAMLMTGCKKDEDPKPLNVNSLMTGDIDLNAASAPTDVPVNPSIIATFTTNVDPTTATADNITLIRDYDDATIELTISVSDKSVTITPTSALGEGTLYQISFTTGLASVDGLALSEALTRSFTTQGTFVPTGQVAYWNFDNNTDDQVGDWDPTASDVVAITYADARSTDFGKAASFDGDASIIEVPNGDLLINTTMFTLSFWVKTNSEGHVNADGNPTGHYVMGLGAFYGFQYEIFGGYDGSKFAIRYGLEDGSTASEDMWFPSEATDNTNGGWQGWDFAKSLTADQMMGIIKDKWYHVVYTFNGEEKAGTLYFNGEKMKSFDFDLWPDGDAKRTVTGMKYGGSEPDVVNKLAFGFIQSRDGTMWDTEPWGGYDFTTANHFKGLLDDVRIFHAALTSMEVQLLYNSEKP